LIAAGQTQTIDGIVRIAASEAVSAYLLPPIVDELRTLHPGIKVELVVSNSTSDLRRREADIAVRHFRPQGDDLVTRLIKEKSVAHLYVAPSYLERIGNPRTAEELGARGQVIAYDESDRMKKMLLALGLPFRDDGFSVFTDNHLVQWELAKRGVGMCIMMEEVGDHEPMVVRALPDFSTGVTFPTWLTSHRELKSNRRIRVVFDLLAEKLGG
jgi:DNA-binding transcriptional LysR family regulator